MLRTCHFYLSLKFVTRGILVVVGFAVAAPRFSEAQFPGQDPSGSNQSSVAHDTFVPGELIIGFAEDASVISAIDAASEDGHVSTGISGLDSLGIAHNLQSIVTLPHTFASPSSRRYYTFVFSTDADILAIAQDYAALPYVSSAEPNLIFQSGEPDSDQTEHVTGVSGNADFDGSGRVDFNDFFMFADAFDKPTDENQVRFDLTGDGRIDFDDFFVFADAFGQQTK